MSLLLNSATADTIWNLDPTTIPDCDIWFDAADTSTITTTGTTVNSWKNKGSLVLNAVSDTGTCTTSNTVNGLNYISCPAATQLAFTCPIINQARTWFVVARSQTQLNISGGASPLFWGPIGQTAGSGQDSVGFLRNAANTYTLQIGPSGVATRVANTSIPNPLNTLQAYCIINSTTAASNLITINGLSYTLTTSSAAASYNVTSLKYTINVSSYSSGLDICEIIHYGRDLTLSERQSVESYLMWKWGIKQYAADIFVPTSITGCLAWFDADVDYNDATSRATSFTFSSGDLVDVWKDKSGNGQNCTFLNSGSSTNRPGITQNQLNRKTTVVFAGATTLRGTLSLSTTQSHTLFVVAASNALGAFRAAVSINSYPGVRGNELNVYQTVGNQWWYSGGSPSTDGNTSSITVVSGQYDILAFYWAASNAQMNINGQYLPPSTSAPASLTANSVMLIGSTTDSPVNSTTPLQFWSGGIAEIIIYNGQLTIPQRNLVEQYLTNKWNRQLTNSYFLSHPGRRIPILQRNFVPTDIDGCTMWLDAADLNTITFVTNAVSVWNDKSGNSRNATQVTALNRPTYDYTTQGLVFNGTNSFLNMSSDMFNALNLTNRTYTIFIAEKRSSGVVGYIISGSTAVAATSIYIGYSTARNFVHSTGDNLGNSSYSLAAYSTADNIRIFSCGFNASTRDIQANSTVQTTGASGAVATTAWTTPFIGYHAAAGGTYYAGTIYEIIIYNRFLNTFERSEITDYLLKKWSTLPSTTLTPTSISGCNLWLDASDTSSVTLSGASVTAWNDKSGNSNNLTAFSGPTYTTLINGLNTVTTNGSSSYLERTTYTLAQPFTVFIVARIRNNGTASQSVFDGTSGSEAIILYPSGTGTVLTIWAGSANVTTTPTVPFVANTLILYTAIFNAQFSILGANAVDTYTINPGTSGKTSLRFGLQWTGTYNPADWCEVIIYNRGLGLTESQSVQRYLVNKWGISTPWPIYPLSTPMFNPLMISGLRLWLDASDSTTLILSGSNVLAWRDKSVNRFDATLPVTSGIVNPVYATNSQNGLNIVQMRNNSDGMIVLGNNFVDTNLCYFIVLKFTASQVASAYRGVLSNDNPGQYGRSLGISTTNYQIEYQNGFTDTGVAWSSSAWAIVALDFIGTASTTFYLNGSATAGTASGAPFANTTGLKIGYYNSTDSGGIAGLNSNLDVGEILVFNVTLTRSQRQQVEGYLAWKWGLVSYLPTIHPYKKVMT